jgi:hypothetical protein
LDALARAQAQGHDHVAQSVGDFFVERGALNLAGGVL